MSDFKTTVTISSRFPSLNKLGRQLAAAAVVEATKGIRANAQALVQEKQIIDTGTLLNSIQATVGGRSRDASGRFVSHGSPLRGEVSVGAEYGIYHEYGTIRMAARPFFWPAVEKVRPALLAAMKQIGRRVEAGR